MNKSIYKWLGNYLKVEGKNIGEHDVEEMLKSELATSYLIVWPILEQKLCNGFFKPCKISNYAEKYISKYEQMDIDDAVKHFYERYQDKDFYRHLKHGDKHTENYDKILASDFSSISDEDKINFILYVVYRYRNNIFHGNKKILSWAQYSTEINLCLEVMMKLIDNLT